MTEGTATQLQGRRRIIERPRLTRLLDESHARIKLLVAPAGYGKSTLARQWTAERPRAWYRISAAAADVASVSRGIATAAADVLPGCSARLEERLRITKNPDAEFATLAEMLVEDLQGWPEEAWLVLDDAQHLLEKESTSKFVATLVRESAVNTLLCTRQRPAWITARDLLYGEALEIGRNSLAMTHDEAADVMRDTAATPGVVALADGWPAVVGLASLTPEPTLMSGMAAGLPESLYDYLAEELYQALPPAIQESMCLIAVAGVRSRRLVERLFPPRDREKALREVVDAGWLTSDADGNFELHPLLEAFLRQKLEAEPTPDTRAKAALVTETLIAEEHWDEAFGVIERYGIDEQLLLLVRAALEDVLASGRTASLMEWIGYAERRSIDGPDRDLAFAELLFREGRFHESEVCALAAADALQRDGRRASPAFARAGRAAHAANREHVALNHYKSAKAAAGSADELRVAALGELSAAIDLEVPEAALLLSVMTPAPDDVEALVEYTSRCMALASRSATAFDLQEARRIHRLLHLVRNPITRCSFRNAYGHMVASAGDTAEARAVVAAQLSDAASFRLDFVVPYAHLTEAVIELVLGRLDCVQKLVDRIEAAGRATGDDLLTFDAISLRSLSLVSQGRFKEAVHESSRAAGEVTSSVRGELLACRAIALACDRDYARALSTAQTAVSTTHAVEACVGAAVAQAIVAGNRQDADFFHLAREALRLARDFHATEFVISGYRGAPQLAHVLLESDEAREEMMLLLSLAGDLDLFSDVARGSKSDGGTWEDLTRREREVLALVAQGLSNRGIASNLFIAEATVKVHVGHILEKLGVPSRTAAALHVPHHARLTPRRAEGSPPREQR